MSEELNSCPICGGYLFEDDDVVYCPDCGAPHHRDCYAALGHCGRQAEHGKETADAETTETTPESQEEKTCRYCKKEITEDTKFCPYCGKIQPPKNAEEDDEQYPEIKFETFSIGGAHLPKPDPYGGLDKNSEIDGVKVKDIARFVAFAPNKLLPKFKHLQDGARKFSWNWMAFISPYAHALFRKMGFSALMYALLELTSFVLMAPFYYSLAYMDMPLNSTTMQIVEKFFSNPFKYTSPDAIILLLLGVILFVGYRIFAGLNSDSLYKKHVIDSIKKIRSDLDTEEEYEFYRKGGVRPVLSLTVFLLMFYFGNYIPIYIAELLFS